MERAYPVGRGLKAKFTEVNYVQMAALRGSAGFCGAEWAWAVVVWDHIYSSGDPSEQ